MKLKLPIHKNFENSYLHKKLCKWLLNASKIDVALNSIMMDKTIITGYSLGQKQRVMNTKNDAIQVRIAVIKQLQM